MGLPQFQTGRYSKYLPARLLGRYQEAVADPELLGLKDDIALLDTRIGQAVSALSTGESRETWAVLVSLWSSFESDWQDMAPDDMAQTVERVGALIRAGLSESHVWAEIRGLLRERAGLVAAEQKRLVEMQQYVTAEQAMTFVGAVMASVRRHVSEPGALANISADLTRFTLRDGGQPRVAGPAGSR